MTTFLRPRLAIALAVGLLGALSVVVLSTGDQTIHITAHFPRTVGIYKDSEVRLMGVPIGRVTAVEPEGTSVRVDLEYDGKYEVSGDAKAVLISSSIIADRFVQLTPAFSGQGKPLADGATLPLNRTVVPVELDEVFTATNDVLTALGPHGANRRGAVGRLLSVGADTLDGQGDQLRDMLHELAGASGTLGSGSEDLFAGVDHLQRFTRALAGNDQDVRAFNQNMADVATFLGGERQELSQVLAQLAQTFGEVNTFVHQNRSLLVSNVDHLARISTALVAEREALASLLKVVPVGISNLAHTFDPTTQGLRSRANEDQLFKSLDTALCDSLVRSGVPRPKAVCDRLATLLTSASAR